MYIPESVPQKLVQFIQEGTRFLVAGHKEPDGDCVGSQLALCSFLQRLGKQAAPYSAGPFERNEVAPYQERFFTSSTEENRSGARAIIVDCSSIDRIGDIAEAISGIPAAVIDHHAYGSLDTESPNLLIYLDQKAPSTTFMIYKLMEAMGYAINAEEAELLFLGLCTDTGFFRHIDADGAEAFLFASHLVRAGASPKHTYQAMYGGKSLGSRRLMGAILARTESHYDGKLLISTEEYEDTQRLGLESRDSDTLYQLLQSVSGIEAIAIIRQESAENCTIGLRSRDRVNVATIAAQFGGGGHRNAAGAMAPGTTALLKPQIIEAFRNLLS